MATPRISILLPVLNQARFLAERLRSIREQTFRDWELIAVDGFSDDGSWEIVQEAVAGAAPANGGRAFQAPRRGLYAALNAGLAEARGGLVHIATADDSMAPDFLEKLAAALDRHPECGLAHGDLEIVDEGGAPVPAGKRWGDLPVPRHYFGAWMARPHVRPAPHDGFLHGAAGTVYTCLHQLLIRRAALDRTGPFRDDLGPAADFEWGMRAALLHSVVHVPGTAAIWRRHPAQATRDDRNASSLAHRELAAMAEIAARDALRLDPALAGTVDPRRLSLPLRHQAALAERRERNGALLPLLARQWRREPDLIPLDARILWQRGPHHRRHLEWMREEMRRGNVPGPAAG